MFFVWKTCVISVVWVAMREIVIRHCKIVFSIHLRSNVNIACLEERIPSVLFRENSARNLHHVIQKVHGIREYLLGKLTP